MEKKAIILTQDQIIEQLVIAVSPKGDFPVSGKIVQEIFELVEDPRTDVNLLSEAILKEPTLGARIVNLVNISINSSELKITSLPQAISKLGMRTIPKLCGNFVLLQQFIPRARSDGPFAFALNTNILSVAITKCLLSEFSDKIKDRCLFDPMLVNLSNMGQLVFAYYFPEVFEACIKRSINKNVSLGKALNDITGLTPFKLSLHAIEELNLSPMYHDVIKMSDDIIQDWQIDLSNYEENLVANAKIIAIGTNFIESIVNEDDSSKIKIAIEEISSTLGLNNDNIDHIINNFIKEVENCSRSIGINVPTLPEILCNYKSSLSYNSNFGVPDAFQEGVKELQDSITAGESEASIIGATMDILKTAFNFSRIIYFEIDSRNSYLIGKMAIGDCLVADPRLLIFDLESNYEGNVPVIVDVALRQTTVFHGSPLFKDSWPLVSLPVGFGIAMRGVIYADKTDGEELGFQEQAAISILTEMLDRGIESKSVTGLRI
jgi:hypothetical protein